ncbi:hypothetical protein BLA6863_06510 [Burkholderia lata]|uniref:Uncharacterized protein n=1 Tax=Burkholderia lata (strain ATCC 17760 / DSM 23089 / LMG 22485 / NCIMB 9086 / R18194 / 383) TaxID=482957 RepID=A0A6P2RHM1_BURL3|nr:hypothetical protein BLA6863_06510 [Burkholderia lata]
MPEPITPATCQYSKEGHADCAIRSARADTRHPPRRGGLPRKAADAAARAAWPRGVAARRDARRRRLPRTRCRDIGTRLGRARRCAGAVCGRGSTSPHQRVAAAVSRCAQAVRETPAVPAACARDRPAAAGVGRNHRSRDLRQRCRNGRVVLAERRDARRPALAGREPRVHAVRSGFGARGDRDPAPRAAHALCRRPAGILLPREPRRPRTRCKATVGHGGAQCIQRHGARRPARGSGRGRADPAVRRGQHARAGDGGGRSAA